VRLASAAVAGGIRLDPASDYYVENTPARFNFSAGIARTGLVKVRGLSVGYTWTVAQEDAATRIRLLCAAMSLGSGMCWIQRGGVNPLLCVGEGGVPVPFDGDDIDLPSGSPWDATDPLMDGAEYQVREMEFPSWLPVSTAAALRDLIMLRFVVAVENAEVPGFGLGG
jgi:hypothetical protein